MTINMNNECKGLIIELIAIMEKQKRLSEEKSSMSKTLKKEYNINPKILLEVIREKMMSKPVDEIKESDTKKEEYRNMLDMLLNNYKER